jgi:hypothetical protein
MPPDKPKHFNKDKLEKTVLKMLRREQRFEIQVKII